MTTPFRTGTATPTRPTILFHDVPEQIVHGTHRSVATCMAGCRILGYSEGTISSRVMCVLGHGLGSLTDVLLHLVAGISSPISLYPLRGASDVSLVVISARLGEILEPVTRQERDLVNIRDVVERLKGAIELLIPSIRLPGIWVPRWPYNGVPVPVPEDVNTVPSLARPYDRPVMLGNSIQADTRYVIVPRGANDGSRQST